MELLLLILLIVIGLFGYPYLQDARENALAKRLEKLHDSHTASASVDALIAQSRVETEQLNRLGKHRF